jgi:hypothetical protein
MVQTVFAAFMYTERETYHRRAGGERSVKGGRSENRKYQDAHSLRSGFGSLD